MQPKFEAIRADGEASFSCKLFSGPGWRFDWHHHPEYELTLINRGRGQRFVGDHIGEFQSGDLVLLGPNLPHTWYSRPPVVDLPHDSTVIQFLPNCLGEGFFDRPELKDVAALLRRSIHGIHFRGAKKIAERIAGMPRLQPLARLTELVTVLSELSRARKAAALSSRGFQPQPRRDQRRIERVLRYVNENYTSDLTIEAAAAIVHLSPSAFSRFFHQGSGKTFTRYVNELRVGRACELLADSDRNIAVIALDCGFNNLSNFNRRFLDLRGVKPREYRRRFQQLD